MFMRGVYSNRMIVENTLSEYGGLPRWNQLIETAEIKVI